MVPDARRDHAVAPSDTGHLGQPGDRVGHEMDDELSEAGVERCVRKGQGLGRRLDDVDTRVARRDRRHERLGRIGGGDIRGADARNQLGREGTWSTPDIEHLLTGPDPGELGHLRGQQDRIPAHESVIRLGGDIETHRSPPSDVAGRHAKGRLPERSAAQDAAAADSRAMEEMPTVDGAMTRPAIPPGLLAGGVVAIGRRVAAESAPDLARALAAGGVRAFELTLNEPEADALRSIEAVARVAAGLGLEIGAGTVLSIEAAGRAVDAGATFLVSPHLDPALVSWAAGRGIPAFPGCSTPTEVLPPGARVLPRSSCFRHRSLGPAFIRELRGPFPDIPVVPTGGVTVESAPSFVAAGAVAVGMGGWLLGDGVTAGIRERAARWSLPSRRASR